MSMKSKDISIVPRIDSRQSWEEFREKGLSQRGHREPDCHEGACSPVPAEVNSERTFLMHFQGVAIL